MVRTFDDRPAVREKTPIMVGLVGPSGTGKTYSALRLATGFQQVSGGDIHVIDTEGRRSLHYAETFKFRHVAFAAPFGSLDYLAAIEHCVKKGAGTIVIDSMSHEHEGPGGVLEQHDTEFRKRNYDERYKLLCWAKPKGERRRLINAILQMTTNFVFCFRAKKKLLIVKGEDPKQRGWQPIAGEEFIYEMTLKCLLLPGANGVPTWNPKEEDEKAMVKLPGQFRSIFAGDQPQQLSEETGKKLAAWAAGAPPAQAMTLDELVRAYLACCDGATFRSLEQARGVGWSKLSAGDKAKAKKASEDAEKRVAAQLEAPPIDPDPAPAGDATTPEGPQS